MPQNETRAHSVYVQNPSKQAHIKTVRSLQDNIEHLCTTWHLLYSESFDLFRQNTLKQYIAHQLSIIMQLTIITTTTITHSYLAFSSPAFGKVCYVECHPSDPLWDS